MLWRRGAGELGLHLPGALLSCYYWFDPCLYRALHCAREGGAGSTVDLLGTVQRWQAELETE